MEAIYVIKRPLVTEKSTFQMNEMQRYAFEVDPRASKTDIKKAVEEIYELSPLEAADYEIAGVLDSPFEGVEARLANPVDLALDIDGGHSVYRADA